MNNHYIISNDKIIELLDVLDSFTEKMQELMEEYPKYSYEILFDKDDYHGWKATIKVKNNDTHGRNLPELPEKTD